MKNKELSITLWVHRLLLICCLLWNAAANTSFFILHSSYLNAQPALEALKHNRNLAASNYMVYPEPDTLIDTPAPDGARPFYISHYGRHGSRYLNNDIAYTLPCGILSKADSIGLLTPLGQDVLRQLRMVIDDLNGRKGDLTELGFEQHQHIAHRMMLRYPEVFEGEAHVQARSTVKQRCILSMGAAMMEMLTLNPRLHIDMDASEHDMWYLNYQDKELRDSMKSKTAFKGYEEYTAPYDRNPRLMSLLFRDTSYVRGINETDFNYYIFKSGIIQQNTHLRDSIHLTNLYTDEEVYHIWQKENAWWYFNYGPCLLNGGRQHYSQRMLLRKLIQDADSCLQIKKPGVQLRYGHETVLLPLVCLMDIRINQDHQDGYGYATRSFEEAEEHGWHACHVFPMAANLQFIFYRRDPHDSNVLVKVLLNEHEVHLPLPSASAPYYPWADVRKYYLEKLDAYGK